jgi:hypothetical protein
MHKGAAMTSLAARVHARTRTLIPRSAIDWAVWYARIMTLFALQGLILIILYAIKGPQAGPDDLPPGLQLDRTHAVIHLVSGIIGAVIGFWKARYALRFIQLFAVFYLLLAIFGTFTHMHFGMQLQLAENGLHWTLGGIAAVIGFVLPLILNRSSS